MSKCKAVVCDVCREHLSDDDGALFIRAKRRWCSWHESGFINERLCVCARCQEKLAAMMKTEVDNG